MVRIVFLATSTTPTIGLLARMMEERAVARLIAFMFAAAWWLRTPSQCSVPFFTCWSHDQLCGSDFNIQ